VVLGGSIVVPSRRTHLRDRIAVTNDLRVSDIVDSLLVHPSMAESLAEAVPEVGRFPERAPAVSFRWAEKGAG